MSTTLKMENLAYGAVLEQANISLQRVLDNIVDPNTEAKAPREVQITVRIEPDEDRFTGKIRISTKEKLAGDKPINTVILINDVKGKGVASEYNSEYRLNFGEDDDSANSTQVRKIG